MTLNRKDHLPAIARFLSSKKNKGGATLAQIIGHLTPKSNDAVQTDLQRGKATGLLTFRHRKWYIA